VSGRELKSPLRWPSLPLTTQKHLPIIPSPTWDGMPDNTNDGAFPGRSQEATAAGARRVACRERRAAGARTFYQKHDDVHGPRRPRGEVRAGAREGPLLKRDQEIRGRSPGRRIMGHTGGSPVSAANCPNCGVSLSGPENEKRLGGQGCCFEIRSRAQGPA
jgi:hypothetical protein